MSAGVNIGVCDGQDRSRGVDSGAEMIQEAVECEVEIQEAVECEVWNHEAVECEVWSPGVVMAVRVSCHT